jgi:hypothetical protein
LITFWPLASTEFDKWAKPQPRSWLRYINYEQCTSESMGGELWKVFKGAEFEFGEGEQVCAISYISWNCKLHRQIHFPTFSFHLRHLICTIWMSASRSQWPHGLRQQVSSPAGTLGSCVRSPLKAWTPVCVYCVRVVLCVGSGLTSGWSPSKDSYQLCKRWRNWKKRPRSNKGL